MLGIHMLEYFKKEEALLVISADNHNISSDIIESNFGIYKVKKSPNKLYGITPFVLFMPLHSKLGNDSAAKIFDFKEHLCNVKLKDIDTVAKSTCPRTRLRNETKHPKRQDDLETLNWILYLVNEEIPKWLKTAKTII